MAPWLWSASASAAPPRSKTRLTSGPSRASTAAENSSVKWITSPGLSRRAGLANACQHPSDRCRCNVSSTRASPLTPTRRAGITRVWLKTIRSPGRSRGRKVGHSAMGEAGAEIEEARGIARTSRAHRDRLAREVEIEGVDPHRWPPAPPASGWRRPEPLGEAAGDHRRDEARDVARRGRRSP